MSLTLVEPVARKGGVRHTSVARHTSMTSNHEVPTEDLADYHAHLIENRRSRETIKNRLRFARRFWRDFGTWQVTRAQIVVYLDQYDGWTSRTYHNAMSCLHRWLLASGRIEVDPVTGLRRTPMPDPRPWPLLATEMGDVVEAAEGRVRAFVLLGWLAGLRVHEIAKFHGRDIDSVRLSVLGKNGQWSAVPTHPVLWELAQEYPRDDFWFPSPHRSREHLSESTVSNDVSKLIASAIAGRGSTHRNRYTYGTELLRTGANIKVVQKLLRHRHLSTTALYLGVDEQEKIDAIHSIGPATTPAAPAPCACPGCPGAAPVEATA